MDSENDLDKLSARIKELGGKSTQVLLFLSFAFVAVVTLKSDHAISEQQQQALTIALRWWVVALAPVILGIAPLKEFVKAASGPYTAISRIKVGLLWLAIIFILIGANYFGCGIWPSMRSGPTAALLSADKWNSDAIKAQYVATRIFKDPSDNKLRMETIFDLFNNTTSDYTLEAGPSESTMVMQKLKSSDALVSGMGLIWSLEHGPGTRQLGGGGIPIKIPKGAFIDTAISIPSFQAVRVDFFAEYDIFDFAGAMPGGTGPTDLSGVDVQKEFLRNVLKDTEGFVLLDKTHHFRINLPLQTALQ